MFWYKYISVSYIACHWKPILPLKYADCPILKYTYWPWGVITPVLYSSPTFRGTTQYLLLASEQNQIVNLGLMVLSSIRCIGHCSFIVCLFTGMKFSTTRRSSDPSFFGEHCVLAIRTMRVSREIVSTNIVLFESNMLWQIIFTQVSLLDRLSRPEPKTASLEILYQFGLSRCLGSVVQILCFDNRGKAPLLSFDSSAMDWTYCRSMDLQEWIAVVVPLTLYR